MPSTPEFVRWSLNQSCPLRDDERTREPEWVERQLRALRSCGEALADGREIDGICLASAPESPTSPTPPLHGFRTSEVLAAYGDEVSLDATCGNCPARVVPAGAVAATPRWAGCFGWIDWSTGAHEWHAWVDEAMVATDQTAEFARQFLVTRPAWYGLWVDSPLRPAQIQLLDLLLEKLVEFHPEATAVVAGFRGALAATRRHSLELDVAFGPTGVLDGTYWTVVSHCSRCKAPRPDGSRRCGVCGQPGPAAPARRRHARGTRPYLPLERFLSAARATELLDRYWRQRAERG